MTSTVVSWALTVSLVGVGVYYYRPDLFKGLAQQAAQVSSAQAETATKALSSKKGKSKKSASSKNSAELEASATGSSGDHKGTKKRKIVSAPSSEKTGEQARPVSQSEAVRAEESSLGDREFAQQLAKAQTGTNFQKSSDQNSKKKTKATKQSRAQQLEPAMTGTSPEESQDNAETPAEPSASSTQQTHGAVAKSGDVSDMLEAPAPKPTTLRLTGVAEESKNKTKKPSVQPFEQVLTKKQRQTQARKEEMRQMKEESDRLHEAKKQEQLRSARTAAGTSNQTKANNFAKTANAWQTNGSNAAVKATPANSPAPLLDTFNPESKALGQTDGAVSTQDLSGVKADSAASLKTELGEQRASVVGASDRERPVPGQGPSPGGLTEEDQIKLLAEQEADDAWESVTSKKSKAKKKATLDLGSSELDSSVSHPVTASIAKPAITKKTTSSINQRPDSKPSANRFGSIPVENTSGLMDAEWEA